MNIVDRCTIPVATDIMNSDTVSQVVNTTTLININKRTLPKMPVPDLETTTKRYLRSLRPLLSDTEYQETERIVQEFEKGIGAELQRKLLERYECTDNWAHDYFVNSAYLGNRTTLVVESNPGDVGPPQKFTCPQDMFIYAGKVISAILDYDSMIKSGKIKQQMVGEQPLDMQQYAMILGRHRRPEISVDRQLHTNHSKHIIVLHNNHIFKLHIYADLGTPFTSAQFAASLKDIASRLISAAMPVGILTGNDRDTWVTQHEKLRAYGSNDIVFEDIETAMFALCLDKPIPTDLFRDKNYESVRALQILTGISLEINAGNRWYDKCLQYIVASDGYIGINFEHSQCEGVPIAFLHDHILKYVSKTIDDNYVDPGRFPKAQILKFEIFPEVESFIFTATRTVEQITAKIDVECRVFDNFGTEEIKNNKLSPDSFIQIGIQLAYYRLHGKPAAQYEAAALRRFRNARTASVRSTCIESVEFTTIMLTNSSKNQKKEAMVKAVRAHKQLTNEAITGQGVDRHLFSLKMLAASEGLQTPEFFCDIGYTKSTQFALATSQVPHEAASFMCYGPIIYEGYACCYNPRPRDILFGCSSYTTCKETSSNALADAIQRSLCEMMDLLLPDNIVTLSQTANMYCQAISIIGNQQRSSDRAEFILQLFSLMFSGEQRESGS